MAWLEATKVIGGGQYLLAFGAAGLQGQVQGRGARIEGDGVFDADVFGEALFKCARLLAIAEPTRCERF